MNNITRFLLNQLPMLTILLIGSGMLIYIHTLPPKVETVYRTRVLYHHCHKVIKADGTVVYDWQDEACKKSWQAQKKRAYKRHNKVIINP